MFGDSVFDKLEEWIRELLVENVRNSISKANNSMAEIIDLMRGTITDTPQSWNSALFTQLQNISKATIVPIAVGIMTIIICYDLITACADSNNMKDFDIGIFFRFIVKAWVAIFFINNIFTITGGIFEIGSAVADKALTQFFDENTAFKEFVVSTDFEDMLSECSLIDLLFTWSLSVSAYTITLIMTVIVMLVTAGRMIEILIYFCAAPIPFATMTNKEWNNVGFSFLKNLFALALQAFFIVIILAIYVILFNTNMTNPADIGGLTASLLSWICYSIICCFMLMKTGSISKSICGAQ